MIIHLCPLAALDDALRQRYRDTLLNAEERMRLGQFKRQRAADQFLAGRALLRSTLGELLGRDPQSLQFTRNADDKPLLVDGERWQFNLSHCDEWAALALSRDGEVGVDIESSARRNDIDGIAERFFQPEEAAWLQSLPAVQRREKFFQLWTVKEATVKALGTGIAGALIETGVRLDGERIAIALTGAIARPRAPLCWHTTLDRRPVDTQGEYHLAAVLLPGATATTTLSPTLFLSVPLQHLSAPL